MHILVIDMGTSSLKLLLFDAQGRIVLQARRRHSPVYSGDSAEMDPCILERNLWDALEEIAAACKEQGILPGAVSVTAQRSSVIPVDQSGNVLHHALMWQDKRSEKICESYASRCVELYAATGMKPSPVLSASKIRWLKAEKPSIYEQAHKLIGFHEYLLYLVTGQFLTDTTIAGRSGLMDVRTLQWSPELLAAYGVDGTKLCAIVPVGSICGTTCGRFREIFHLSDGIPVVSAGGDQQCAALGMGCVTPGATSINTGTGAYVLTLAEQPLFDDTRTAVCNPAAIPHHWVLEGSVFAGGSAIEWMNRTFFGGAHQSYPYEDFDRAAESAPPGANGLLFFSSLCMGEGPPESGMGLLHVGLGHTKADFARALMEGLAFDIAACVSNTERVSGQAVPSPLRCGGGLSENPLFTRLLADILGKSITVSACSNVTALGAWISAAVASGMKRDYGTAYEEASAQADMHTVAPDPERHAIYMEIQKKRENAQQKKGHDQHA